MHNDKSKLQPTSNNGVSTFAMTNISGDLNARDMLRVSSLGSLTSVVQNENKGEEGEGRAERRVSDIYNSFLLLALHETGTYKAGCKKFPV